MQIHYLIICVSYSTFVATLHDVIHMFWFYTTGNASTICNLCRKIRVLTTNVLHRLQFKTAVILQLIRCGIVAFRYRVGEQDDSEQIATLRRSTTLDAKHRRVPEGGMQCTYSIRTASYSVSTILYSVRIFFTA